MEFQVATIEEIKRLLENQLNEIQQIVSHSSDLPEWLNDEQCWKLKGGMALNTYRTRRFYQCKGGIPDAYVGGRKVWSKESVIEWLPLTDDQLPEYHNKYKTGAKRI